LKILDSGEKSFHVKHSSLLAGVSVTKKKIFEGRDSKNERKKVGKTAKKKFF